MFKSWFAPSPSYRLQLAQQIIKISANQTVLQSALLHGVNIPHGCKAGGCGICKCRLISGEVEQIIENSAMLTATELNSGIFFACCSVAKTDLQVEILTNSVSISTDRDQAPTRVLQR